MIQKTFALTFNYFLLALMLTDLHFCTTRKLLKLSGPMPFLFILKPPFSNQPKQEEVKTLFSSFSRRLNGNKRRTNTKATCKSPTCVLRNETRWHQVRRKTKIEERDQQHEKRVVNVDEHHLVITLLPVRSRQLFSLGGN